jgi:hypothetical protein
MAADRRSSARFYVAVADGLLVLLLLHGAARLAACDKDTALEGRYAVQS